MRVLLIGEGAREHIIAQMLAQDAELYAVMSRKNPGIAKLSKKFWIADTTDAKAAAGAVDVDIDLAFASPDAVLAAGVSDALSAKGIPVASPMKAAARIEWDKGFMRSLMGKHKVAGTPRHKVTKDENEAISTIREYGMVAIKPLGLSGGKGVKVSGDHFKTIEEKFAYAQELIRKDGSVLIEEKLVGEEFTLQAFCDGTRLAFMPPVQDHKRAFEGDLGPNCYSADTEILTKKGWKTFDNVDKNDKVMIYDKHWRIFQFQKPREVYWMKYKGKMIHFKNRDVDLLVTPNHRMLLQQRRRGKRTFVIEAGKYRGENYIFQSAKWNGRKRRCFKLPAYKKHFNFKSIIIDFKNWTRFLGIFLSEGYVQIDKGGGRVYICQMRKSRHWNTIKRLLESLPFRFTYEEKNNKFRTNSIQLASNLKQFGDSYQKYVPDYIKNADESTIIEFLNYFCMGDGDIHMGKLRFHSASKRMIGDFQEMLAKVGCNGIVVTDKRKTMVDPLSGRTYNAKPVYSIEMKKRHKTSIRKKHVKVCDYDGYVGCVNVSSGFVFVRRNGRVAICGNTGGMGSYSTGKLLPFMKQGDLEATQAIMKSVIDAMRKEGVPFIGVLYGQFMLTAYGPKVIEFNSRFGDPEAMNVLSLLQGSLSGIFLSMAQGKLGNVEFSDDYTVEKYLVPQGYPGKSVSDAEVSADEECLAECGAKVFHASVYEKDGRIFTTNSRTFGILGRAKTLGQAEAIAEAGCACVTGPVWHRKDIGTAALVQKRIDHMKELKAL